jgi:hypothetical protein
MVKIHDTPSSTEQSQPPTLEGREPQHNAHPGFADDCGEAIGETVAKIDAKRHERRGDHRAEKRK